MERKSQATVEGILDAAQALMSEEGLEGLTLEAISQRADVAVQTIYNRVGGRDTVMRAVARRALAADREYLDDAYRAPGTLMERLRGVAAAYVRFATERPNEFRLLVFPPPGISAEDPDYDGFARQIDQLGAIIAEGIETGEFDGELDPKLTAILLWRLFDGVLSLTLRTDRLPITPDALPDLLVTLDRFIENGLKRPALNQ